MLRLGIYGYALFLGLISNVGISGFFELLLIISLLASLFYFLNSSRKGSSLIAIGFYVWGFNQSAPPIPKDFVGHRVNVKFLGIFPAIKSEQVVTVFGTNEVYSLTVNCFASSGIVEKNKYGEMFIGSLADCDLSKWQRNFLEKLDNLIFRLKGFRNDVARKWVSLAFGDSQHFSSLEKFFIYQLGIGHIFSVSGLHLLIWLSLMRLFFKLFHVFHIFFPKALSASDKKWWISSSMVFLGLIFFCLITGLSTSVLRSSICYVVFIWMKHRIPNIETEKRLGIVLLILMAISGAHILSVSFLLSTISFLIVAEIPQSSSKDLKILNNAKLVFCKQLMLVFLCFAVLDFQFDLKSIVVNWAFVSCFLPIVIVFGISYIFLPKSLEFLAICIDRELFQILGYLTF